MYKAETLIPDNATLPCGFLFEENGYSAEMCLDEENRRLAYHLRYRAYLNAGAIAPNSNELCTDPFDEQKNARTYLIRYEGRPVASVRSFTRSADYDWTRTPAIEYFQPEIDHHLGLRTAYLEINRYVVDPGFQGLQSLTAQMLMYRIQALSTLADGCDQVIAAVRPRHVPFYRRLMNFEVISEPISVADVNFQIQLMVTPATSRNKLAQCYGIAAYQETDLRRYRRCLYLGNSK